MVARTMLASMCVVEIDFCFLRPNYFVIFNYFYFNIFLLGEFEICLTQKKKYETPLRTKLKLKNDIRFCFRKFLNPDQTKDFCMLCFLC